MDRCASVCFRDFIVVDLGKPVVGCVSTGVRKDQTADRIGNGGILLDTPVIDLQVVVYQVFVVQQCGVDISDFLSLTAIQDVGFGNIRITGLGKNLLDAVLDLLHGDLSVFDLAFKIRRDMQCE